MIRLRHIRMKLGLSQRKLAEWLGCKQSKISKIESGKLILSLEDACKIVKLGEVKNVPVNINDFL